MLPIRVLSVLSVLFSVAELAVLALLYRFSLPSLGELLQQREKKILQAVTQEVE